MYVAYKLRGKSYMAKVERQKLHGKSCAAKVAPQSGIYVSRHDVTVTLHSEEIPFQINPFDKTLLHPSDVNLLNKVLAVLILKNK